MTDDPTPDPIPDPVPDPIPDPTPDPEPEHHEPERPSFVDEILDRIDNVVETLTKEAPESIAPVVDSESAPDTSPSKPPWTHRGLFGRKG